MTKNLQTLCDLFDKTNIDYEIVAENQISVEIMALELEHKNPQFATNKDLDEALWGFEEYVHIFENSLGEFEIIVAREKEIPND